MVADMPLDIRTVDHFAAVAASIGPLGPFENVTTERNDLKFRCG
jgi:hypothetical protein